MKVILLMLSLLTYTVSAASDKKNQYSIDRTEKIDDQYETVLTDLEKEQDILYKLEESYDSGAGVEYLKEPIVKAKRKIASIQREKVRIERTLASENKSGLDIKTGVMLDAYYMNNLNNPAGGSKVSLRNYDQSHNDFTINLAEVNFSGNFRNYGFYVDLDFGEFAEQNSSDSTDHNIGQAFMTYESNGYTFNFGKMYTNVGYEVAKSQENWNYSRSFAFSNAGPFWHEGASLTKSYDNGFGWGVYVYDQSDARAESNGEKTYSIQLNYSNDKFSAIYNFLNGAEGRPSSNKRSIHEFNTQYDMSDSLSFAFNAVFFSEDLAGKAGKDLKKSAYVAYMHYKTGRWSFTPRFEIYEVENNTDTAEDTSVLAQDDLKFTGITLTTGYELRDNTEVRFEVRRDSADQKFYLKDDSLTKDQSTLSLSWLMKF